MSPILPKSLLPDPSKIFTDTELNVSRYKQPQKLEDLSLRALGEWVAMQAERHMEPIGRLAQRDINTAYTIYAQNVKIIRNVLEYNVPWMLHDSLAAQTIISLNMLIEKTKKALGFRGSMGKFVSQINIIITMAEALFTKHLTVMSLDHIPKMMRTIFFLKLNMFTGLVYLNLGSLSGGWKTNDMENSIIQSIKSLKNLKYLYINYDCTDNILLCISQNCPQLERLDVSCSKSITNDSIDIIVNLKKLKCVQLYRTSVTLEGFTKLLINCKPLEDIGRCDEIGKVLEYIDLTNSEAGPFGLTTFVSRYAPQQHLQLSVTLCPKINNMTVFHNTLQGDLMALIALKELRELKLLSCDFYADRIKQLLEVKGCNIVNLHLEHVDQIDLNALMYVSQMCPLLKSFTLYNCTLIQHTSLYTKQLEILPFRNLKRFTCVSSCSFDQLAFVLMNSLNVEYIHIGTAIQLTDEFVLNVIDKNPLIHLKELRVMQSDCLTMQSVEKILESCMSLQTLIELESWTSLTDIDREYIRNHIRVNNFNVKLIQQDGNIHRYITNDII